MIVFQCNPNEYLLNETLQNLSLFFLKKVLYFIQQYCKVIKYNNKNFLSSPENICNTKWAHCSRVFANEPRDLVSIPGRVLKNGT